jgi:ubiquinone/menaquinone biosynthesis C-methylase UbiE
MPDMYEIYDRFASQYDELIRFEDHHRNLDTFINSIITGNTVLELGSGTGRVTKMYIERVKQAICVDRSMHMIEKAKINLDAYTSKITFQCMDVKNIRQLDVKADCIIEGWALGHSVIDEANRIDSFVNEMTTALFEKLNPNGQLIFIETLGTNTEEVHIPDESLKKFYQILEDTYGMKRHVVRTDYMFDTIEDAQRILSFFFGEQMKNRIKDRFIKEYTGVWVRKKIGK